MPGSSRIDGFVVARLTPPEAELESIAVAAALQRSGSRPAASSGIGTGFAGGLGVSSIALEVRASNQAARGFYEALRFTEVGRRRSYYADPIEDAVLMERTGAGS